MAKSKTQEIPGTVGAIAVGERRQVRVVAGERDGAPVLDMRLWLLQDGAWTPGPDGLAVRLADAPALAAILLKAARKGGTA